MLAVLLIACLGMNLSTMLAFAGEGEAASQSVSDSTKTVHPIATYSQDDEDTEDEEEIEDGDDEDGEDIEDGDDEDGEDEDGDDEDGDDEDGEDEDGDEDNNEVNFIRISSVNYNTNNGTAPVYQAKVADGDVSISYEGWKGSDGTVSYSSYAAYRDDDEIFDTFRKGVEYTYSIRLAVKKGKTLTSDLKIQLNNKTYTGTIHKSGRIITLANVYTETSECHHNMVKKTTKGTCTTDGFTTYKCKYCDYNYTTNLIKATGHQWEQDEEWDAATDEEDGSKTFTCEKCGKTREEEIPMIKTVTLSSTSYTYNGQARKPTARVVDAAGNVIPSSQYTVEYDDNKNAGTATARVIFDSEESNYEAEIEKKFRINPASQSISVKVGSKNFKKSALKKKSQSFSIGAKAKNKLSYKSGSKRLSVSAKGKVTVKKGTPKGTYKVTVSAKKSTNYKAASKTVTVKVA